MSNTTKLSTKILILIVILIISVLLSSAIAWCLVQIFAKTPEAILEFSYIKVFSLLTTSKECLQIFVLVMLIFGVFVIFSVVRLFDLNSYLSKTYKVTPQIEIPLPVGKKQTQHGSAWWLDKKVLDDKFGHFTFDPTDKNFKDILNYANEKKKDETKAIDKMKSEMEMESDVKKLSEDINEFSSLSDGAYFVNPDTTYNITDE